MAHRFLPRAAFSEKLVTAFLLYLSQVTVTVLFAGVVLRNLGFFPLIALNITISLGALVLLRKIIKDAAADFFHRCRAAFSYVLKTKDILLYIILFLFLSQLILILVKIYFLPPHVWDVFAYHLQPAAEWLQKNMITDYIDTPVVRLNRNPMGLKLFYLWIVKFLNDIAWLEIPQFLFGLLSLLSAYALMLKMNIKKNSALKYAVLIYFIPLILIESRTCQDHLALLGAMLMAALYAVNVFYHKEYSQLVFLGMTCGLVLGIKISGLHIIIVLLLALLLSGKFKWSAVRDFFSAAGHATNQEPVNIPGTSGGYKEKMYLFRAQVRRFSKTNTFPLVLGVIFALALGGYWYIRNLSIIRAYWLNFTKLLAVKPLLIILLLAAVVIFFKWALKKAKAMMKAWPLSGKRAVIVAGISVLIILCGAVVIQNYSLIKTFVLGYTNPGPVLVEAKFYAQHPVIKAVKSKFTKNLLVFPFRIKDIGLYTGYTPDFLEQSGFGVQFFGFGLVAYIIMTVLIFRKKYRTDIPGFLYIFSLAMLGTYFTYYYSSANYRLFMFFPVVGIMLWAFFSTRFKSGRVYPVFIDLLIIGMILFNFTVTAFDGNLDSQRWKTTLTLDNPLERTSIQYSPFFKGEDWIYIDNYIPVEEPIGYLGYMDSWVSPYYDNRLRRRIYHLKSLKGFQVKKVTKEKALLRFNPRFIASLKARGIHYIHINPQGGRHLQKFTTPVFIANTDVIRLTDNLYYYKW